MTQDFNNEKDTIVNDRIEAPRQCAKKESNNRKFMRVVLGSMTGFILASMVLSVLSVLFMIGIISVAASFNKETIDNNSILELKFNSPIEERATENPFADLDLGSYGTNTIGLDDIIYAIKNAANDEKIKGISLNVTNLQASPASISEIRDALLQFKKSGKFIYAYNNIYSQNGYYLASVADSVLLNPKGEVDIHGLAFQLMFYKGLIDKLDIDVQVVKCGKFKSAVEPFLLNKMSEANRQQMSVLGNSIWGKMVNDIAISRHITAEDINCIADKLLLNNANDAKKYGLIDILLYPSEYTQFLKNKIGINKNDNLHLVSLSTYRKSFDLPKGKGSDKIAIIYAIGEIIDGKGNASTIGDATLCKEIRRAYKDDHVKAIVLRVNSPGGSALASETIWNEIENAKNAGKIVVTSMGDYAASGGYYISCNSNAIVAQPNTLTGSIGVFGMIPSFQRCLENKLGISIDVVKTNEHADAMTGFGRTMTTEEYLHMQASVDEIYDTFLTRVSTGRNLPKALVDSIGQGRVWTGTDAINIGLIDKLGTIEDAITLAAEMASLTEYKIVYYPQKDEWFTKFFNQDKDNDQISVTALKNELGEFYPTYMALKNISQMRGIQARIPIEISIK